MTEADVAVDGFVAEGEQHDRLFAQFVVAVERDDHDAAEQLSVELARCYWRMMLWLRKMDG